MSQTGLQRLETLRKLNETHSWLNKDIYRLLYKKDLYIAAYKTIQSRSGSISRTADDSVLDGFRLAEIERTIEQIKDCSFQFSAGRRENKPTVSALERPTAQLPPREKVVQEVIRLILEAIYDSPGNPHFLEFSHGFRNGRGTHTALKEIRKWHGTCWFIQGTIKGCYEAIDHHKLIELMTQKIADDRFLDLIRKALKSGCLEAERKKNTLSDAPQGSIISPLLANIYLHELDFFIKKLSKDYDTRLNEKNKSNQINTCTRIGYIIEEYEKNDVEIASKTPCSTPATTTGETNYIKLRYSRYADDWLIGLAGPKKLAVEIGDKVQNFLFDKLNLGSTSTTPCIKHAKSEKVLFLGTLVCSQNSALTRHTKNTTAANSCPSGRNQIRLEAPIAKIIQSLHLAGFCNSTGRPIHKKDWLFQSLEEIITRANAGLKAYRDYYSFADNFSSLRQIQYIIQYSCAKTISAKMKLHSLSKTFKKYTTSLRICRQKGSGKIQLDLAKSFEHDCNRFSTEPGGGPLGDLSALYLKSHKKSPSSKSHKI